MAIPTVPNTFLSNYNYIHPTQDMANTHSSKPQPIHIIVRNLLALSFFDMTIVISHNLCPKKNNFSKFAALLKNRLLNLKVEKINDRKMGILSNIKLIIFLFSFCLGVDFQRSSSESKALSSFAYCHE